MFTKADLPLQEFKLFWFFFFLIFLLFKDLSVNIDNVAFKLLCIVTLTHKSAIAAGNLI